jgi:hypothetical protein
MKKTVLLAAILVVAFGTSCKKNYTCTCTSTVGGISSSASATAKMKKKDAKTWCDTGNSSTSYGGTTSSTTCKLD